EEMINFVFSHFQIKDIRIDTHPLNKPMIRSLERQGFVNCGIVHVKTDSDSLRFAYHKNI
ncbi:MAG: GNAT family protein, partial [Acholeplasmatales bacterium]|nr:GNAT family protein [Acholeplasmatales bacterium]